MRGRRRSTGPVAPDFPLQVTFDWMHQGCSLYDAGYDFSTDFTEYAEAADGSTFGQSLRGAVTYMSPGGAVWASADAPLTIWVLAAPPAAPDVDADAVGEFDLLLPTGSLVFEGSGGGHVQEPIALPSGRWRARWSGWGAADLEERDYAPGTRPDRYQLDLWRNPEPAGLIIHRG